MFHPARRSARSAGLPRVGLLALLLGAAGHGGAAEAPMRGALADYPMGRDGSGTAWQPDTATMPGLHAMGEVWTRSPTRRATPRSPTPRRTRPAC